MNTFDWYNAYFHRSDFNQTNLFNNKFPVKSRNFWERNCIIRIIINSLLWQKGTVYILRFHRIRYFYLNHVFHSIFRLLTYEKNSHTNWDSTTRRHEFELRTAFKFWISFEKLSGISEKLVSIMAHKLHVMCCLTPLPRVVTSLNHSVVPEICWQSYLTFLNSLEC